MNVQKIRHPLALLREQKGMTHGAYAMLVAQTHAELGFGTMAARREKVARWESGRITPETSAQLAMAHLHGVPRTEVERLGWPDWLYTATGHSEVLSAPWTYGSAVEAMNRIAHASPRATEHRYGALSCTDGIADLCAAWLDGAAGAEWLPAERGQRISGATVAVLEDRQKQLHHLYAPGQRKVGPGAECVGPSPPLPPQPARRRAITITAEPSPDVRATDRIRNSSSPTAPFLGTATTMAGTGGCVDDPCSRRARRAPEWSGDRRGRARREAPPRAVAWPRPRWFLWHRAPRPLREDGASGSREGPLTPPRVPWTPGHTAPGAATKPPKRA
ncbi:hypothetical protein BX283_0502 [Streptomyces sp. TLI_146]|nr:hypothetical protein BX283_0502 [Streptomyces sp. TLI_146]